MLWHYGTIDHYVMVYSQAQVCWCISKKWGLQFKFFELKESGIQFSCHSYDLKSVVSSCSSCQPRHALSFSFDLSKICPPPCVILCFETYLKGLWWMMDFGDISWCSQVVFIWLWVFFFILFYPFFFSLFLFFLVVRRQWSFYWQIIPINSYFSRIKEVQSFVLRSRTTQHLFIFKSFSKFSTSRIFQSQHLWIHFLVSIPVQILLLSIITDYTPFSAFFKKISLLFCPKSLTPIFCFLTHLDFLALPLFPILHFLTHIHFPNP